MGKHFILIIFTTRFINSKYNGYIEYKDILSITFIIQFSIRHIIYIII